MKRNEMLALITLVVFESDMQDLNHKETANRILKCIEDAGMAPPTIISLPNDYNRTEGCYGFEVNEWESEDET